MVNQLHQKLIVTNIYEAPNISWEGVLELFFLYKPITSFWKVTCYEKVLEKEVLSKLLAPQYHSIDVGWYN